jgi:sodium-dependent dicarboxylate transporter 2/3/5
LEKVVNSRLKPTLALLSGPLLFAFTLLFNPFGLDEQASKVLAVAFLMIAWWIAEALPMPAVALLPLVLFPLMGIAKISEAAAPYANEVVFLFMGGFLIGLGIEKWNLHRRIALAIVQYTGTNGNRIILGFILATGLISMWLSNTATTMMMLPIAASVISVVVAKNEHNPHLRYFAVSMMLAIAYAANFGGIATIIGTPPNVAYASFVSKQLNNEISFSAWMLIGLPVSLLLLFSLYFVLINLFPSKINSNEEMKLLIRDELAALGPMTVPEKRVLYIFLTTAGLWIFRDLINKLGLFKLDDNMIAVFGGLLMFIVPAGKGVKQNERILVWSDTSKMAWGILLLFGGGITLAAALEKAGLIKMLGIWLSGFSGSSVIFLVIAVTVISLFISEVMSNVAQVIVFAPVVTGIATATAVDPYMLGIPMTLAASCASMMPMGTPPNAIVFSTGHLKLNEMMKAGLVMNLVSIILIILSGLFLVPFAIKYL